MAVNRGFQIDRSIFDRPAHQEPEMTVSRSPAETFAAAEPYAQDRVVEDRYVRDTQDTLMPEPAFIAQPRRAAPARSNTPLIMGGVAAVAVVAALAAWGLSSGDRESELLAEAPTAPVAAMPAPAPMPETTPADTAVNPPAAAPAPTQLAAADPAPRVVRSAPARRAAPVERPAAEEAAPSASEMTADVSATAPVAAPPAAPMVAPIEPAPLALPPVTPSTPVVEPAPTVTP